MEHSPEFNAAVNAAVQQAVAAVSARYDGVLGQLQSELHARGAAPAVTAPTTTIITSDHAKKPAFFSGEHVKGEPTLTQWVNAMAVYLRRKNINTAYEQIETAGNCLTSTAITWYNTEYFPTMRPDTASWEHFVAAIHGRFEPVDAETTARAKLHRLKQTGTITAYNSIFNELMGKVGLMMEKDKIYHYLKGLRPDIAEQLHYQFDGYNSSLSDYMKKAFTIEGAKLEFRGKFSKPSFHRNFNQSYQYAQPYTNTNTATTDNNGPVPMELGHLSTYESEMENENSDNSKNPEFQSLAAMDQRSSIRITRLSDAERERCRVNNLCFRCRKPGHTKWNCPLSKNV